MTEMTSNDNRPRVSCSCGEAWADEPGHDYDATASWDWAICQDGGVSDRFPTSDAARAALPGYPPGCTVQYVPSPPEFDSPPEDANPCGVPEADKETEA